MGEWVSKTSKRSKERQELPQLSAPIGTHGPNLPLMKTLGVFCSLSWLCIGVRSREIQVVFNFKCSTFVQLLNLISQKLDNGTVSEL